MDNLKAAFEGMIMHVPDVVKAVLLALLTWIIANIARSIVVKGGKNIKLPKLLTSSGVSSSEEKAISILKSIGNLIFFLIVLFMVPAILESLNIESVSRPFTNMLDSFTVYIPKVIGAIIIIFIGHLLAKVAKELIISFSKSLGADKLAKKLDTSSDSFELSTLIGNIVYALIIIPVSIAAIQTLGIRAVSDPSVAMLSTILNMIPNVIAASIIIVIGVIISKFVQSLLSSILKGTGIDKWVEKSDIKDGEEGFFELSTSISIIVKYILILLFVVEAIQVLNLEVLTSVGSEIINYLPRVIGAVVLLVVGYIGANFVGKLMSKASIDKWVTMVAKVFIYAIVIFMVISQLNLATNIVETAFTFVAGAVALAFVLAFGLGGKDFASEMLARLTKKIDK